MKTLLEIKQSAKKGDYTTVAELIGKSDSLVRAVVNEYRNDHWNIQKTFSDYLEARERLQERERRRQEKKKMRDRANT